MARSAGVGTAPDEELAVAARGDGAMTSGIREAKRLLGLPSVRLGPIPTAHT